MSSPVHHERSEGIATITLDDGKVNALSPTLFADLFAALDRAEADGDAVVLAGRPGIFSGGFHLGTLLGGGQASLDLLRTGFDLSLRLLAFPRPVVIAATGHAYAMGAFLLLSVDHRVGADGADGEVRITANEVKIGLTMPRAAVEVCRARLTPAAFHRAVDLAAVFDPTEAVAAGFLDEVAPAAGVVARAQDVARSLAELDGAAHAATKLRSRAAAIDAIGAGNDADQV